MIPAVFATTLVLPVGLFVLLLEFPPLLLDPPPVPPVAAAPVDDLTVDDKVEVELLLLLDELLELELLLDELLVLLEDELLDLVVLVVDGLLVEVVAGDGPALDEVLVVEFAVYCAIHVTLAVIAV